MSLIVSSLSVSPLVHSSIMQSFWFIFCTEPGGKWADMVSGQRWPDTLECSIVERLIEIAWRVTEAHQAITHTHCNYETIRVCRQQRWRGWAENAHRWMKSFLVTTVEVAAVDRVVAFVSNDLMALNLKFRFPTKLKARRWKYWKETDQVWSIIVGAKFYIQM